MGFKDKKREREYKNAWARRDRKLHPEKYRKARLAYAEKHRENNKRYRDKLKRENPEEYARRNTAVSKRYRNKSKKNRGRVRVINKKAHIRFRRNHQEECRKKSREYNRRSKKRAIQAENKRKRMEWLIKGDVTRQQLIDLFELHNDSCHYCGKRIRKPNFSPLYLVGFDHKTPMSRRGRHTIKNIVPSCINCNSSKNNKTYSEYMKWIKNVRDPALSTISGPERG